METSEYPKKAGIYKLTCVANGKIYVGKSVSLNKRLNRHKNCKCSKNNSFIHNAILKYGWGSFEVEILEIFEDFNKLAHNSILLEREAHYIQVFKSANKSKGYNICEYSNDCTGRTLTEEHKEKLRKANIGKKMSEESIEKTRQANLGRKNSPETIEKIRLSRLGKKASNETKEKLRNRRHSDETKEKMRQARLGKPRSEETKRKCRENNIGKKRSEETKEKIRQANLGKKRSDEVKERIRQTMLATMKRKREQDEQQN